MAYRNFITPLAIAASVAAYGYASDTAQAATSAPTEAETCLQQHIGKLDTLFTQQVIAPYVQDATENVEAEYDKKYEHKLSYSWPSDRTRTVRVSGMEMSIPVTNIISLGSITTYTEADYYDRDENDPIKRFQRGHHNLTAEEKAKARAAINEHMKNESESTRKIGNAILGAATTRIMFEPVTDIGDAAAWNIRTKEFDVLTGATEFSLQVDVSADNEKNKTVAKEVAQYVLAGCSGASNGE